MEEKQLRERLSRNMAYYRKYTGLTQAELAEKLNYSDKSVSKWERGDGLPDINVLVKMTEVFNITLDDMVREQPLQEEELQPEKPKLPPEVITRNRIIITLLSVGLVWFVASLLFFIIKLIFPASRAEVVFMLAVPVSFIVSTVMVCLWWGMGLICTMVSCLVWSIAACIDLLLPLQNSGLIYIAAGVFQLLIILWYFLKSRPEIMQWIKNETAHDEGEPDEESDDK